MSTQAPGSNGITASPTTQTSIGQSDEIASLKEQIASLKLEFSHSQKRHDREMEKLLHKTSLAESNFEEKLAYESSRIKKLTEMTTEQDSFKVALEKLSANQLDKIKTEIHSEVVKQSATISQSLKTDIINELQPRVTESIKSCYKPDLDKLSESITARFTAQRYGMEDYSNKLQNKTIASITSDFKPELDSLKSTVSTIISANATLKPEVSQLSETVCAIEDYHQSIKMPVKKMIQESQNRDQRVQQIVTHQEQQDSTIEQVNAKISDISHTVNDYDLVRSRGEDNENRIQTCREELSTEHISLKTQMDEMQKTCQHLCEQQQASSVDHARSRTPSTITEPQSVPLDRRMARNEENIKMLNSIIQGKAKEETDRDEAVSQEITQMWNFVMQLEGDMKKQAQEKTLLNGSETLKTPSSASLEQVVGDVEKLRQDWQDQADQYARLSTWMEQLNTQAKTLSDQAEKLSNLSEAVPNETRQQLDQLRSDQTFTSATIQQIKVELGSQNENLTSLADRLVLRNQSRQDERARVASPQVNGIVDGVMNENEVQPKLEALESKVDFFETNVSDKVKAMESTLCCWSSRFNNISTEPLVMSVIHTLQTMYPLPALQFQLNHLGKEVATIKQELGILGKKQDEADRKTQQQISDINQEVLAQKQQHDKELFSLTLEQGLAKDKHEQLVRSLKAEREVDLKTIAEIRELVKSSAGAGDEERRRNERIEEIMRSDEVSKTSIQDLSTKLKSLEDKVQIGMASKIQTDIDKLRTRVDSVAQTAQEQKIDLGNVKDDFYNAQTETHAKTKDLAKNVQDQAAKIDSLEKKADTQADRIGNVEELNTAVQGLEAVVAANKTATDHQIDALRKEAIHEIKEVSLRLEALYKFRGIDSTLEYVERGPNASVKSENVAVEVAKIQGGAAKENALEIASDSDEGPIKPLPKRAWESMSATSSVDRPAPKKPRTHLDNDGGGGKKKGSSQGVASTRNSEAPSSQQTDSPSSRPKRGRPPRARAD
ncbi:MAG: hypothetical protein Q9168_003301 [Polycauliona sp. 1 TL-2023]